MEYNKTGKNLGDVQEMNRSLLIQIMRIKGECTRSELAKATGLKQATVSKIMGDFIDCGIVKETRFLEGEKGRRSIGIQLNSAAYKAIGVKLARHYITVGLYDLSGTQYETNTYKIDMAEGSKKAMEIMKNSIQYIMEQHPEDYFLGIGVASPGPFVRNEGRIILMTEFPGWEQINIIQELQSCFELPVRVEHDANCCVTAEWWLGANSCQSGTMMSVIVGQGVGAGIIMDGKLLLGSMGIAGEIGHMSIDRNGEKCKCGNRGCLYKYCSTVALTQYAQEEMARYPDSCLQGEEVTPESVYRAVQKGDALAMTVVDKIAWNLGFGLANVVNIYNPDVIVLCDEMIRIGPRLLEKTRDAIQEHVMPELFEKLEVHYSELGDDPALLGAAISIINDVAQTPSLLMENNL